MPVGNALAARKTSVRRQHQLDASRETSVHGSNGFPERITSVSQVDCSSLPTRDTAPLLLRMSPKEDAQFLALLVHRGYLARDRAETLLPALKEGAPLDDLLVNEIGWEEKKVSRLRRTRAGEEPEIPGYEFLGRLGVGGTAQVFRVREKKTGRAMALKILSPLCASDPRQLRAFVNEAK